VHLIKNQSLKYKFIKKILMKIHNIFFDILCDVYYHFVKFEFKIPLMHGEIKRQIQLGGKLNQVMI